MPENVKNKSVLILEINFKNSTEYLFTHAVKKNPLIKLDEIL